MALSDDESAILSHIGTLIYYGIVVLIVDCTLYGFYLLAECIALYLFIKHGFKQRIQKILFITSVGTLLTATWDFVNQCSLNLIQIKVSLMEPLAGGLKAQAAAAQRAILPWVVMMAWPISLNVIVGNGIVLWRAWAVCHEDRSIRSAIIAMAWVNTGICLADAIVDTVIRAKGVKSGNTALDTAQLFICLAINMAATGLIGMKYRQNPELVKDYFGQSKNRREKAERMLLVLTESGAFLLLFQLLYAIFGRMNMTAAQFSPVNIAYLVIETIFNEITILYAVAVIIMVLVERSALDKLFVLKTTINISTSEKGGIATKISTLRFAEGGRQVATGTSTTGVGSDIEAQEDSHSDIVGEAIREKSQHDTVTQ